MQTTLLTIAVAIILALLAALVGPFFIDWGNYRTLFEREASRLTGLDVHVRGAIDARLLPSPRLQLNEVTIGSEQALRARTLAVEFALGPLLRGEWRAEEMRLIGPEARLTVDSAGQVKAPSLVLDMDPDALSIERLGIEGGRLVLSDVASGASYEFDKLWFNGELRSLVGPIKGEGAVTFDGALYPFRLSSGRANADGALRVHLNIDPVATPLNIEADGALSLLQGKPQFQGTWSLVRPVGITEHNSSALVTQPWRLSGKVKATPASALMEQVDFQYGSDADAIKLSGTAELTFGLQARFNGVLSARQIDLDRLVGEDDASRGPPAVTIRRLVGLVGNAFRPPFPIHLGVGVDAVTLGGTDLQNLRGDVSSASGGWTLDRFEFRAPGLSDVRLSGQLGFEPRGVVFTGPAEVVANNPNALAAWLEGRRDVGSATARPLRLRGDVTLGGEKIAIERLNANFNSGAINGRFVYLFGDSRGGARIEAGLNAPELDLDAVSAFAKALLGGSTLERPHEAVLALDIGRARYAGIETGKTSARLQYDANGLRIEQLSIENFGGATVRAQGQVAFSPAPRGSLVLDLDARDLSGINAIVARYRPALAERLVSLAPALAPAKLHATFKLDDDSGGGRAALSVNGSAGMAKLSLSSESTVDLSALNVSNIRIQSQVDASDASALAGILGLDRIATVNKEPATLRLTLSGNPFRDLAMTVWMSSTALQASATGTLQPSPGDWPTGSVYLNVARVDLAPLRGTSLPAAFTARINSDGKRATADEISAVIAGSKMRGNLSASLTMPSRIDGILEADTLDIPPILAAAAGMPKAGESWRWATTPFVDGITGLEGQISLAATRANLASGISARQFRAKLALRPGRVSLNDMSGSVAGGELTGAIAFMAGSEGLTTKLRVLLNGADAATLLPWAARPPVNGRLTVQTELEGTGRSPATLIGSLHGAGKVALGGGQFAGLDPRAFAAITRAVDQGVPVENVRIEKLAASALESGQFTVKHAEGDLSITAGQIRLNNAKANGEGAELSLSGVLDLTNGTLDSRLVLTGPDAAAGTRPEIFVALHGPLETPTKTLDVSGLTGWLTLRAIETQSKKLDAIEAAPELKQDPKEPKTESKTETKPVPVPSGVPASPPATAASKPKESSVPKKPAPPRAAAAPPNLPPPFNILPAPSAR